MLPTDPDGSPADMGALVCVGHSLGYGQGKTTSIGTEPLLNSSGTAKVGSNDFGLVVTDAIPGQIGLAFYGPSMASSPFLGGTLWVGPPLIRLPAIALDAQGAGFTPFQPDASMAWDTLYFQFWLRDPDHPDGTGSGLSSAVMVSFCSKSPSGRIVEIRTYDTKPPTG